jgi:hypothetical protein
VDAELTDGLIVGRGAGVGSGRDDGDSAPELPGGDGTV